MHSGQLITLSGLDGAGKTTLSHALLGSLTQQGHHAEEIEMGPSSAWRWTQLLEAQDPKLRPDLSGDRIGVALNIERFGFVTNHVMPALRVNHYVILQRYVLDWAAVGRSFGAGPFETRMMRAFHDLLQIPVLMIHLDIPPEVAAARIRSRGASSDPREQEDALRRTARAYRDLEADFPNTMRIDGTLPTDQQVQLIHERLREAEGRVCKKNGSVP